MPSMPAMASMASMASTASKASMVSMAFLGASCFLHPLKVIAGPDCVNTDSREADFRKKKARIG